MSRTAVYGTAGMVVLILASGFANACHGGFFSFGTGAYVQSDGVPAVAELFVEGPCAGEVEVVVAGAGGAVDAFFAQLVPLGPVVNCGAGFSCSPPSGGFVGGEAFMLHNSTIQVSLWGDVVASRISFRDMAYQVAGLYRGLPAAFGHVTSTE